MTNEISLTDRATQVKDRTSIESVIGQYVALRRAGREFVGLCPFHNEKTPSFTVAPEKGFAHCFGCSWNGDVIDFLRDHQGIPFKEAIERLESEAGVDGEQGSRGRLQIVKDQADQAASLFGAAMRIWREARDAEGTLVERYLMSRSVGIGAQVADIRYHPRCPFGKDDAGNQRFVPAMVALVRNPGTREPMGIHRTELTHDGRKVDRKMLGPCHGGVVMLAAHIADTGVGISEGIETGLAVIELGGGPVWATLSRGSLERFPLLGGIHRLTIFADNDKPGIDAAQKCAKRWLAAGLAVEIQAPQQEGDDFADVLALQKRGNAA